MSLKRKFIRFVLPSMASMLVFNLYTMVDGIFIANYAGETALAAVNLAMPFINFMFAFSLLLSIGASTLISIHRGAGRTERANELFTMNTAVLSVLALLISAGCVFFAKPLAIFLGAGSDTLSYVTEYLRIIGGFLSPTSGDVLFNGQRINDVPAYKRKINTVFQRYALFPHLDVYDNIAFGLRIAKVPESEIDDRVTEMLEIVSLKGFGNRRVTSLSGGQQQRVAIARALASDPEIIYFDEPTSALDPELTGEVLRVLRDLADRKTTMIIVTHEMHFARDVADRILFMDGGVVVEEGPARQLIDHPQEERTKQFLAHYSE